MSVRHARVVLAAQARLLAPHARQANTTIPRRLVPSAHLVLPGLTPRPERLQSQIASFVLLMGRIRLRGLRAARSAHLAGITIHCRLHLERIASLALRGHTLRLDHPQ